MDVDEVPTVRGLERRRLRVFVMAGLLLLLGASPRYAVAGSAAGLSPGLPVTLPPGVKAASIACVDADTCYVVGDAATGIPGAFAASNTGVLLTLTDGTVTNQQGLARPGPVAIACSSDGSCFVTEKPGPNPAGILPIVNGVPGALLSAAVDQLNGIACSADGACYGVGQRNGADASMGVVVTFEGGHIGQAVAVPGTQWLTDIDCTTAGSCYAVGSSGSGAAIVTLSNGQPGTVTQVSGGSDALSLAAIACPGVGSCYAAGTDTYAGVIVPVQDGRPAAIQSIVNVSSFSALACPTSSICVALGGETTPGSGSGLSVEPVAVELVGGAPGPAIGVSGAGAGPFLSGDCPTSRTCDAVTGYAIVPITLPGN